MGICSIITAFLLAVFLPGILHAGKAGKIVGGPCSYDKYDGVCTVTSAKSAERPSMFKYEGEVRGARVQITGNMADRAIKKGESPDCRIMLQKKGTCTPCMIEWGVIKGECGRDAYMKLFP